MDLLYAQAAVAADEHNRDDGSHDDFCSFEDARRREQGMQI